MVEFTLGFFDTEVTAAVAEDLAARVIGENPPHFSDEDFRQLLPLYGEAVLDGLDRHLPGGLADEMAEAVRRVVPRCGRAGLYERLMAGRSWN